MMTRTVALTFVATLAACTADSESSGEIFQGYSDTAPEYEVNGNVISNVDVRARLWNPRGKTNEQIAARAQFLVESYDVQRTPEQQARAAQAREKYADAVVINSLVPAAVGIIGTRAEDYERGLRRNIEGGVTLTSSTAWAFPGDGDAASAIQRIEASMPVWEALGISQAESVEDVRRAKAEGRPVGMFNLQGSDFVAEDIDGIVPQLKAAGVQVANFVYNNNNALAGGGTAQDMGVTDLGRTFIEALNANDIVVDCSHSSNQTCIDAAAQSSDPIIASHSNPAAVYDVSRNLSDAAILAIAESGGVICPTGVGLFMNEDLDASPELYVEHVVYVADMIGRDRVCFSTDYIHNTAGMFSGQVANVDVYPPESGFGGPASNMAAEHVWDAVAVLEDQHGWTEAEIVGFLGENLLRVYDEVWR
jgi:membrane dipeptidase